VSYPRPKKEPLAIIGIGCRLPGKSDSPDDFWKLMLSGTDAIGEIPPDRWNIKNFYDPKPGTPGKSITKWGAFIDGIGKFDAGFFGISPREADWMDPQQRLLLEACERALEDGGQDLNALRGSPTGVFVGISTTDYALLQSGAMDRNTADIYTATGTTISIAANRVSYVFDLRGPSVAMDTACSSAMTALHFACQSLWRGDCKMALCAGVNALISPAPYLTFSRMGMLSPTGRCQAFDSRGNGFVRGEGSGAVLLKPLSAALADGDHIYACIRATGTNQDGRTNGITVPSPIAQEALVRETCAEAGLKPSSIHYVEAHGTGTPVGDPIEAHALGVALGQHRPAGKPLLIGSVKTNIGHLEAAAGIAGLIKLALVLKHRVIPANLHFRKPNPNIDLKKLNLRVVAKKEKLPATGPLFGAINSFGFGGANAHAVLESPPELPRAKSRPVRRDDNQPYVLNLSARSIEALKITAREHHDLLRKQDADLEAICRSAALRRTPHPHRLFVFGNDRRQIAKLLSTYESGGNAPEIVTGNADLEPVDPVFVCSGQGPQWWGMGRELIKTNPVFRAKIEECDRLFREFGSWSLLRELSRDEKTTRMDNTAIAQPAIFAIQVGLAAVWESLGVKPAAVVGHSVGEVAAAHIAGVFTLRDAARVIFYRGDCMSHAGNTGKMLAVGMQPAEAEAIAARYPGRVVVGAYNGPASLTLSGDADALEEVAADLEKRGVFNRFLQVKYAFHSHHMDPVRKELARCLGTVKVSRAKIPLYSTVTGKQTNGLNFGAAYWWHNVREAVRFADATEALIKDGHRIFLELSAHPALTGSINECFKKNNVTGTAAASLRRKEPETRQVFMALGALHCAGARVDWKQHFPNAADWVHLPPHPFIREHYWEEPKSTQDARAGGVKHPLMIRGLNSSSPAWFTWLDQDALRWLPEHRVGGHIVFPGAGYIETAISVGRKQFGENVPIRLEEFAFEKALFLPENKELLQFQTIYSLTDNRITFSSRSEHQQEEWSLNAKARLSAAPYDTPPPDIDIAALKKHCNKDIVGADVIYGHQNAKSLVFGPHFQGVRTLWRRDGEAIGHLKVPKALQRDFPNYFFHPAFLDACFHVQTWSLAPKQECVGRIYLPVSIERLRVFGRPGREIYCHVTCLKQEMMAIVYNFQVCDEKGRVLMDCEGFRSQATNSAPAHAPDSGHDWLYKLDWKRKALPGQTPPDDAAAFLPAKLELPPYQPTAATVPDAAKLAEGLAAYAARQDDRLWQDLLGRFPSAHPELAALRRAMQGRPLTQNLREQLEQDSVSRGGVNRLLSDAVAGFVQNTPPDRRVRILECHGSTGGLSAYLLPRLDAHRTAYTFADPDQTALQAAEKKFFGHDFVSFEKMDLAKRVSAKNQHDIVIAHQSTPEMAANLRRLVAPGGLLLLLGHHAPAAWTRAVFELPAKSSTSVKSQVIALRKAGFAQIDTLELPGVENIAGYDIIAARAPLTRGVSGPLPLPKPEKPASWLLFADEGGFAKEVAAHLESRGGEVLLLAAGPTKAAVAQIIADARRRARFPLGGVAFLRALDFTDTAPDGARLQEAEKEVCHASMHLIQALTERGVVGVPPVWFVTRGAEQVLPQESPALAQSALVGLVRTMGGEYIGVRCALVDLTPGPGSSQDALCLARELITAGDETEIAWRDGVRLVNRIVHTTMETQTPEKARHFKNPGHRLEITNAGVIDQLTFHQYERPAPGTGQVEIEIRAAALNFRDVMKALGIYPSENQLDMLVGDECSGVITRVGRGVKRFKPGDEVIASGLGLFASHTTLPEQTVIHKPRNISFAGAVTIPVTFMTAWYALHTLGRMKRGESLLVQAGTGGVGLAAIQLARLAGVEVLATAGSDEKRDFLRALGVEHVFDSRSVSFADDVRRVTGGRGVDLVLNSLAGPAISKGISCLAPHGRFLEIGKRDIYADSAIGLRPFRNNLSMHVIDMGQVMFDQSGAVQEILGPILDLFRAGKLHPLPYRAMPAARAVNAFRVMSAARHIGKIVITMDGEPVRPRAPMLLEPSRFDEKGSYLITGGLGGFGLALAEWMVRFGGARQIILTGRSGASTPDAREGVRKLEELGAKVFVVKMDVTTESGVKEAFAYIRKHCAPLRGVLHAAAVLDDGTLMQMNAQRFARVMAPKVAGTWFLHRATEKMDLDFFVLFSSVAAMVGAAGQGNYAAANSFMDALAHYRRARGLTALSVNWGAISDVGLAARDKKVTEHLKASGVTGITPLQAGHMLGMLVQTAAPQIGFMRVDWQTRAALTGGKGVSPRFEELIQASSAAASGGAEARDAVLAAPAAERAGVVLHHIREIVARVLRTSAAKLEMERPLKEMGLDSLMAFELLHRIEQAFGISLPPSKLSAGGNIAKLSEVVLELVASDSGDATAATAASTSPEAAAQAAPDHSSLVVADGPHPDSLVPLRADGTLPPLFVFHAAGGIITNFDDLVRALPPAQPVFGLQSRAFSDERGERETLQAMAHDYATLVHGKQPHGAIRLTGFSAGGFYAIATANELEKMGRKVSFVGLIDTAVQMLDPGASRLEFLRQHLAEMYRYLTLDLGLSQPLPEAEVAPLIAGMAEKVFAAAPAERVQTTLDWLAAEAAFPVDKFDAVARHFLNTFATHWDFIASPDLRPVAAPMHLWIAVPPGESPTPVPPQARALSTRRFTTSTLQGRHYEIMGPPAVTTLARQLAKALERTRH
jgi:phthiocerol/phenolphthiocerol synthesis type-I polyketide synthase C